MQRNNEIRVITQEEYNDSAYNIKGWILCDGDIPQPEPLPEPLPEDLFDPLKCKSDLLPLFQNKLLEVAPYWSILSNMIDFKNFEGIKFYINQLLNANIITQNDVDIFYQVFTNQSILL